MTPAISIITGVYNSSRYLPHFFQMLDAQTFRDWEAILVDDGSRDQTVSMVEAKAACDPRYRLVRKKPEGLPSRTRAAGLKVAEGEYVAFCDHDDFWAPQKLAMQVQVLRQHPDIAILHTDRVVWKSDLPPAKPFYFEGPLASIPIEKQRPEKVIYGGLQIIFSSFMAHRHLVAQVGFHPDMKGVDDFYLFLRLAQMGSIYNIGLPLTYYYAHQNNLSHTSQIFVAGFYKVYDVIKDDPVAENVKRSVYAQACRTEAVSLFATNRLKALGLLVTSIRAYFIPSTLNRLLFLMLTFFIPSRIQTYLMRQVKRLKFLFPKLKDIVRR